MEMMLLRRHCFNGGGVATWGALVARIYDKIATSREADSFDLVYAGQRSARRQARVTLTSSGTSL
jgi:hypothetical protein